MNPAATKRREKPIAKNRPKLGEGRQMKKAAAIATIPHVAKMSTSISVGLFRKYNVMRSMSLLS
jgi:hypothetical protein